MRISDWSSDVCSSDLEMDEPCLRDIATTAMSLVDRPRPRAKTVRDTLRRFTNVLVWLPRDELSSQRRREIGDLATGLVDGVLAGGTSMMGEDRSAERSVGKECVRTCRSRGSAYH